MRQFSTGTRVAILFGVPILLILLFRFLLTLQITLLPFIPPYLCSFDSVNLALALKDFDPTRNQPQPPGYPFFVAEAHLLYPLFGTPERTFAVLGLLISGLSVTMLYQLGKQMFSPRIGL